jgi:hypothetical protein
MTNARWNILSNTCSSTSEFIPGPDNLSEQPRSHKTQPIRATPWLDVPLGSYLVRSHLINRTQHSTRLNGRAVRHQDFRQHPGDRRSNFMRHVISINLNQGFLHSNWITHPLEPPPNRQLGPAFAMVGTRTSVVMD